MKISKATQFLSSLLKVKNLFKLHFVLKYFMLLGRKSLVDDHLSAFKDCLRGIFDFRCVIKNLFVTKTVLLIIILILFFIRTSNLGAEAKRSYFLRFEPKNVLSMFLKLRGIVYQ